MPTEILPPDPARTIEGLRDTGYEFNTAVADIVDNSIAAGARSVSIDIRMDFHGNVRVLIADNGCGMNREELLNAMKYGSRRRADAASLGKFGLGLKTASTAFCRRLSVLTRPDGAGGSLQATWDLDHVVRANQWELLFPDPDDEAMGCLDRVAAGAYVTVFVWDKVDRLFGREYQDPAGKHARNALDRIKKSLKQHLAMIYQRFLDPNDNRAGTIVMSLDNNRVTAWDPYCTGHSELVASEEKEVELLENGAVATFTVKAFILPRREEFGDEAAAQNARIGNERQGIYIYREQRLIHDASWLGMFQKEPHSSLIRIEFSFDHRLDDAFYIDIKKSRIVLNEDLWIWLRDEFLPAPRRAADERYRKGQKKKVQKNAEGAHDSSNASIGSKEQDLDTAKVEVLDPVSGDVEVTNREGQVRLKLRVSQATRPGQCFVDPVSGIDDGMLWTPSIIDGHKAVQINTGHPYYHKVYVPNLSSGVTVQGMDSLLWALCAAELATTTESSKTHFGELRYEVSRLLRRLVADLPDPDLGDDADAA